MHKNKVYTYMYMYIPKVIHTYYMYTYCTSTKAASSGDSASYVMVVMYSSNLALLHDSGLEKSGAENVLFCHNTQYDVIGHVLCMMLLHMCYSVCTIVYNASVHVCTVVHGNKALLSSWCGCPLTVLCVLCLPGEDHGVAES